MPMSFDPFTELDRLTGSLLGTASDPKFMPVDLYRDGDQYVLTADLPGVDPDSVDVDVGGQLLTIRAQRMAPKRQGSWLTKERPHGAYLRQFSVGEGIDTEKITATYDNGVLSLVLPVSERARPHKIKSPPASRRSSAPSRRVDDGLRIVIDLKSGREADEERRDVVAEAEAILVDALFDEIIRDLTGRDTASSSPPIHACRH